MAQGESKPLAAKGCGSHRELWPLTWAQPTGSSEMGSVSSALSRSRSTVAQLGSSPPPQPEAPPAAPAARKDLFALPKTQRLGPGRGEAAAPPEAWEDRRVAQSPAGRAALGSPELSPVLKLAGSMSQPHWSGIPSAGKSPLS